ncbi:MAG: hypothetical protein ACRYFX_02960 [Janthinobacterium lividum]
MSKTPPKGSLEDLFRHHLLESAEAAVPPRPHVWEQLDNSLLLAQNEKYRRRLLVHRWAIAASLLLAATAGGGWWHSQQQTQRPSLAQATGVALPTVGQGADGPAGYASIAPAAASGSASSTPVSSANSLAIAQPATSSRSAFAAHSLAAAAGSFGTHAAVTGPRRAAGHYSSGIVAATSHRTSTHHPAADFEAATLAEQGVGQLAAAKPLTGQQLPVATATPEVASLALENGLASASIDSLQVQLAQLVVPAGATLPATLKEVAMPGPLPAFRERHWQYGVGYAATLFRPNIDFARDDADYNSAFGSNSALLTRSAAAEYRSHLRAGLGQRLSLWASRRLGSSRFSLRTGLEVAENNAQSATTAAFVGEQVPDFNYLLPVSTPTPLRNTTYRYRSASVPVEVSYSNSTKSGFSLYGKLGGLFSALFNVRSEVEGNLEASRTYTLSSINSPYRHYSASVRGGLGVRYRPAGHFWSLNLGPVAEAGVMSMNLDPSQSFWEQKRPYSIGLEAGLELGRAPKLQ